MVICGIEKFSMVDYDGYIACTLFTSGCNFRCPFCHNSSLVMGGATRIDESEVFDYLKKRKGLVDAVCITGGEPTLHKDLPAFITQLKALGYKIKLDTNGTNPAMLKELIDAKLIDYVAMDIKNSFDKYMLTAGVKEVDLSAIKESIDILMSSSIGYEFRTTLIREYHDIDDIKAIANLLKGANKYFLQKYKDSDECISHGFSEIDKEEVDIYVDYLNKSIKTVGVRGY